MTQENKIKYTRIRVSEETAMKLKSLMNSLSDTYEEVIKKLMKEREGKKNG